MNIADDQDYEPEQGNLQLVYVSFLAQQLDFSYANIASRTMMELLLFVSVCALMYPNIWCHCCISGGVVCSCLLNPISCSLAQMDNIGGVR